MSNKSQVIEKKFNIKEEILKTAALKTHFHPNYVTVDQLTDNYLTVDNIDSQFYTIPAADNKFLTKEEHIGTKATETQAGHLKITNKITPINDDQLTITQSAILGRINDLLLNYVQTSTLNDKFNGRDFNNPISINKNIVDIINIAEGKVSGQTLQPGFYKINYNGTITVVPHSINYQNGILEIKKSTNNGSQNSYIYHLYATTNNQLNGEEYIGYSFEKNDYGHQKWRAYKVPQKEIRNIIGDRGTNVDANSLTINENTSGFIFTWKQHNERFKLPVVQNNYTTIYNFTEELPITGEYIFGNLIGHCDIKITKNKISLRSIDQEGEIIEGVNASFFIPRNN